MSSEHERVWWSACCSRRVLQGVPAALLVLQAQAAGRNWPWPGRGQRGQHTSSCWGREDRMLEASLPRPPAQAVPSRCSGWPGDHLLGLRAGLERGAQPGPPRQRPSPLAAMVAGTQQWGLLSTGARGTPTAGPGSRPLQSPRGPFRRSARCLRAAHGGQPGPVL